MNKGLEALKKIENDSYVSAQEEIDCYKIIETELNKVNQLQQDYDNIYCELKTQDNILHILKEKKVDIWYLSQVGSVETYNNNRNSNYCLTQSQFDTLKEFFDEK